MKKKVITALLGSAILSTPTIAMDIPEETTLSPVQSKKHKSSSAEADQESSIKRVLTVEEFNKEIENNAFLKSYDSNGPMDSWEQEFIENAKKYEHSSFGGIVNRPLEDFKGNILVVGGGKKTWRSSRYVGG